MRPFVPRLLAASTLTAVLAAAPATAGRFDADRIDGRWNGDYTSKTFGTTGVMRAQVSETGNLVFINYEVAGDLFGCGAKSGVLELRRGDSLESADVTSKKVAFERTSGASGTATFRSTGKMVKGSSERTCAGAGPTYKLVAQAKNGVFSGNLRLRFADGEKARTVFKLERGNGSAGCDGIKVGDGTRDACCRTDADCTGDQNCDGILDDPPGRCNTDTSGGADEQFTCRTPHCE